MKLTLFVLSAVLVLGSCAAPAPRDEVTIETGALKGSTSDGVLAFKGVPYAAPPVGDLRWQPPQPADDWDGIREATEYAPDCKQLPFPGDAAPLGVESAEDCLYTNVWLPADRPAEKLPVMVWFYGGGFVNGGSSPAVYDGSQFAKKGVILVSFNYRLGRFGFFAHPALTREDPDGLHGNYAYMDQIAALKWVQRNIAAFGGDPDNVTIFGESAGGGSVLAMLTSPLAKGLFQKAIIESGGGRGGLFAPRFLDHESEAGVPSAESVGVKFAESAGITGEGPEALAELRRLPADAIVAGLNMATMGTPTYAGPMIDGKVVVETPAAAFAAGRAAEVPLMMGANSQDIGFPRGRTVDELLAPFGPDKEKARQVYDPDNTGAVFLVGSKIAADQMMIEPARDLVRLMTSRGQPAYEYRFSYVAESMRDQWQGAPHATEIPFAFDTVAARYGKDLTPADQAMARAMNTYWVNFGKSGDPNGEGVPEWPRYEPDKDILLNFTNQGPVAMADPWKARLDLAESLARPSRE